jgi:ABC-type polysaccharide/polyol phosphate export permease
MTIAPTGPERPAEPFAFLVEAFAITGRRLRHLRRAPGRFLGVTLSPLVSMLVLGYVFRDSIVLPGGADYQEYLFAGVAVQIGLAGVQPTAMVVTTDLRTGLIDRFRSLPISRSAVLFGQVLADFLVGMMALGVVTTFGLLVGWRAHGSVVSVLGGFAVVAAFIYVMIWVGVLLGMVSRSLELISAVAPLIVVVLPFLSNAFLASGAMPALIQPIAQWNPISAVISVCRDLWGNAAPIDTHFAARYPAFVAVVSLGLLLLFSWSLSVRRYRFPAA